jgi:hypothetical protein
MLSCVRRDCAASRSKIPSSPIFFVVLIFCERAAGKNSLLRDRSNQNGRVCGELLILGKLAIRHTHARQASAGDSGRAGSEAGGGAETAADSSPARRVTDENGLLPDCRLFRTCASSNETVAVQLRQKRRTQRTVSLKPNPMSGERGPGCNTGITCYGLP